MGYIHELRSLVGHRPIIMAGACALVLDRYNRLLLQRRSDNQLWGLPGGSMEPGESIEDTARREVFEETGLVLGDTTLLGVFSGPQQFYVYPNGDQIYDLCVAFVARDASGKLTSDEESVDLRYYAMDSLPQDVNPLDKPIIQKLIESLR